MLFTEMTHRVRLHHQRTIEAVNVSGKRVVRRFGEFLDDVMDLRMRLEAWGLRPGRLVGLLAPNCYESLVWDMAILVHGAVSVGLTESHAQTDPSELMERFELSLLIMPNANGVAMSLSLSEEPGGTGSSAVRERAIVDGAADLLTRAFSSGTSGYLKGLNISRRGTEALVAQFVESFGVSSRDRHLIFLPLSNFQQRMIFYMCLYYGVSIRLATITGFFKACSEFQPSFLVAPPAIFQNLKAIAAASNDPYRTLAELFGGNFRYAICGMAPVRPGVLEFFTSLGFDVFEVYGVVECGMVSWNRPGHTLVGSVGQVIPGVSVELAEDGEIVVRKATPLASGYFNASLEDSAATYLSPNTIATGDIGWFDADGFLYLQGRKKNVIVTAGGAKFHPEQVELALADRHHQQFDDIAVVVGPDGMTLYAIVVLTKFGGKNQEEIANDIMNSSRALPVHQQVQNVRFTSRPFAVEDGTITRNMKKDRGRIRAIYCSS